MYYNQSIGGDDLNNIAKDLGAVDFSTFSDNGTYAVDKLNGITKDLVSSGVLNKWDLCKVTYSSGTVSIAKGVVVMPSGAKQRFESITTVMGVTPPCYVYVSEDSAYNTQLCVKDEIDATTYVRLAYIDENGNVSQLATLCQSKIAGNTASTPVTYTVPVNTTSMAVTGSNYVGIYVEGSKGSTYRKNNKAIVFGSSATIDMEPASGSHHQYQRVTYLATNQTLTFEHSSIDGSSWYDGNTFELTVILF